MRSLQDHVFTCTGDPVTRGLRVGGWRYSCSLSVLLKEASTDRRASTPPREHRARRGPRCLCHMSFDN